MSNVSGGFQLPVDLLESSIDFSVSRDDNTLPNPDVEHIQELQFEVNDLRGRVSLVALQKTKSQNHPPSLVAIFSYSQLFPSSVLLVTTAEKEEFGD
jgi:hypothetical protein